MESEQVKCTSTYFEPTIIKLFVNTGADVSLIKLSAIKNEVFINECEHRTISGKTGSPLETFGTLRTIIKIEEKDFNVKFDVVTADFRAPESDIIGRVFIKENRIELDFSQDMFMMPQYKPIRHPLTCC